ncbi:MAG TPA: hypothetical protein VKH41_09370, partial [Myxococcota bacterium]|nr:hypothetical protein [Myxococcota bacterium]
SQKVDSLQQQPAAAAPTPATQTSSPSSTARLAPVNIDNPAISFVVDTTFAHDARNSWESIGYPNGADFTLRTGELFISAPIDPFVRGYASINGTSHEHFDIEEAALVTTALPWNFTVKGGRFHADVGRFPHWHDEALPFVDRPPSIDRIIGGESGSEGVEVSWLAPIEHYIELTGGLYNTVGSERLGDIDDNGFQGRRDFSELTVLGRPHTYFDLTDTLNLELGGTWVGVPQDNTRNLWGADLTLRHQPGTSGVYQGFVVGSEWYWNHELFETFDPATGDFTGRNRLSRQGGYAYLEAFFDRRYSAGARFDYSESPTDVPDVAHPRDLARTGSVFVTWMPSEFQRLRFQFDNTWGDEPTNQRYTIQWTAFLGSHSHGFAQR